MARPLPFLLTAGGLMVAVAALEAAAPRVDLFATMSPGERLMLDELTPYELATVKMAHGCSAGRFDLGLFGNSRSVEVGATDLGVKLDRFFNFSVPGTSLRNSVAMLETFAERGCLPRTVLVSFDHAELQYFKNPDIPTAPGRWAAAASDLATGLADGNTTLRQVARMAWRHAYGEFLAFKQAFSFDPVLRAVTWLFQPGTGLDAPVADRGYRADGSRQDGRPGMTADVLPITAPAAPSVLGGYLRIDLARLARLRDTAGAPRMIVYESPVAPNSHARYAAHPSQQALATRQALLDACAAAGLVCVPARAVGPDAAATAAWTDDTHVPGPVLGGYLRNLLGRNGDTR